MPKHRTSDSSSKKFVQQKLSEIFTSTKRDKVEKDKQKKKLKQAIEKSEREEEGPVVSTSVRQKSHVPDRQKISDGLDESEDEMFYHDDDVTLINEDDIPHGASPDAKSEPEDLLRDEEIRSKLSKPYHN